MPKLLKRGTFILLLAAMALPVVVAPVAAGPVVVVDKSGAPGARATAKKVHHHRYRVGHRLQKRNVVVIRDWKDRGLPRPGPDDVYVLDGDDIYLAAAATLVIKALID